MRLSASTRCLHMPTLTEPTCTALSDSSNQPRGTLRKVSRNRLSLLPPYIKGAVFYTRVPLCPLKSIYTLPVKGLEKLRFFFVFKKNVSMLEADFI